MADRSVRAMRELPTKYPGIKARHHLYCSLVAGGSRCSCGAKSIKALVSIPGTRRAKTKTFRTVGEAVAWKRATEGAVTVAEDAAPLLVRDLAARYKEALRDGRARTRAGRTLAAESVRDIEGCLERHLLPVLGDIPVAQVGRSEMHAIVDALVQAGLSGSRIRSVTSAAGSMWRWAIDRGLASSMPTTHLALPAEGEGRALPPHTPTQIAELIRLVRTEDRAAWALWGWAGLRKLEVARVEWADVDLRDGWVEVREGKTRNATRVVPLLAPAVQILREHRLATGRPDSGPLMRPLPRANPGSTWGVDKAIVRGRRAWEAENDWRELEGRPAVVPITPHPMRHLVGTWLMQSGVQRVVRAAWLGHSRKGLGVTDGVYTHVQRSDLADARDRLDEWLREPRMELAAHRAAH